MTHEDAIRHCLQLAERGRGLVGNGAMVGAVLVRAGAIIAEGYHEAFGKPHAERHLLEKFEQKISSLDVLYVSLEPCVAHRSKKNPPCSDLIIQRGVRHVVYGMADPDPRVAGKGIAALRKAGIQVLGPVLPQECERLNRGFVSLRTKGRPWITLKKAITKAGDIANPDGSFLKITTLEQDTWSHTHLRAKHDAILIGIGTALIDNPRLTIRHCAAAFQPWRIVLDAGLRLPVTAKLVTDEHAGRTIVVTKNKLHKIQQSVVPLLQARGVRVLQLPHDEHGVDFAALWKALTTPEGDFHGIASILVEGGAHTWNTFTQAGVVDEEVTLVG